MNGGQASRLSAMIEKNSNTLPNKDCSKASGSQIAECADYNLVINKANASIKHCIHSSHHDANEKTKCISNVVATRDHDLEQVANGAK